MNERSADCGWSSRQPNLHSGIDDHFALCNDWTLYETSAGNVNPLCAHQTPMDLGSFFEAYVTIGFHAAEDAGALL